MTRAESDRCRVDVTPRGPHGQTTHRTHHAAQLAHSLLDLRSNAFRAPGPFHLKFATLQNLCRRISIGELQLRAANFDADVGGHPA